jgi:hypothetical protein
MSQSSDSLHFNSVSLVERVIKHSRSIEDLPASVFIISVTYEQVLGSESIGLDINVSVRDVVNERRFTDVRESSHDQGTGVSVDLRETT